MNLRMGEATGALMAVSLLRTATVVFSELATLENVLAFKLENSDESITC